MNERLERLLDKMEKGLDAGVDFLGEQAPPYAQEVIAWNFWNNLVTSLVNLGAAGLAALIAYLCLKYIRWVMKRDGVQSLFQTDPAECMPPFLGSLFCLLLFVVLVIVSLDYSMAAAKSKIAPRVVVIDHIKEELK